MPTPSSPLEAIIAQAESLYSLPAVAMEVVQLTASDQVDASALKQCIERDPALAAKLLKVVNSSLFGLSGQVENLTQALALLGTKPLKLLVLGFSLPSELLTNLDAQELEHYWRDALTRAIAARQLLESQWRQPGDDVFLIALLQDIGLLVLLQQIGTPYARFLQQVREGEGQLVDLERRSLGFDHRQVTVELMNRWRMPKSYSDPITLKPANTNTRDSYDDSVAMPQVLCLANLLVEVVEQHRLSALPELLERGAHYCDLTSDDVSRLVAELEPQVEQLAEVLQVDLGEGSGYTEVLAKAHEQLALVAEEAAGLLAMSEDEIGESLLAESQDLQKAMRDFTSPRHTAAKLDAGRADAGHAGRGPRLRTTPITESSARTRLESTIASLAANCREQRTALCLLLVEAASEHPGELATDSAAALEAAMRTFADEHDLDAQRAIRIAPQTYVLLLPDGERREAVQMAQQLARLVATNTPGDMPLQLKAGAASIAAIPKGFEAKRLMDAARGCLSAAQASGGTSIKTIEVY